MAIRNIEVFLTIAVTFGLDSTCYTSREPPRPTGSLSVTPLMEPTILMMNLWRGLVSSYSLSWDTPRYTMCFGCVTSSSGAFPFGRQARCYLHTLAQLDSPRHRFTIPILQSTPTPQRRKDTGVEKKQPHAELAFRLLVHMVREIYLIYHISLSTQIT